MADLIYLAVIVAFFVIAYLLVLACDRIIGTELTVVQGEHSDSERGRAA